MGWTPFSGFRKKGVTVGARDFGEGVCRKCKKKFHKRTFSQKDCEGCSKTIRMRGKG